MSKGEKVAVIGLGNIGLPVAKHLSNFFDVVGFDIKLEAVMRGKQHGINVCRNFPKAEVYVVAVNTRWRENNSDMTAVEITCDNISYKNKNALVCFESTLAVGTARKFAVRFNLENVIVCPHRYWGKDEVNHGVVQLRVIGGLNESSLEKGKRFYERAKIPLHPVASLELAEITKIAENAHRFIQIAFAQELKLIAEANGIDFQQMRQALNTKWNVSILEAREGIGGECLPKDIRYLNTLYQNSYLLKGAIAADEQYKRSIMTIPKLEVRTQNMKTILQTLYRT